VEKHLENIYCKLGVENRTAAVMVAYSGDQER
jgi:DNA-binding NarL/FixJ family response regulator